MEIFGHARRSAAGNGAAANAWAAARSAGFGFRPASTRPNAQSSTGCPPRHQSSVHANTTAPQAPSENAARSCMAVIAACPSSPSRRLSAPASASSSGR